MDKVKQNIIQQQQLDKFNIEKSVVGTEAYYINQDIQKGMSQDEIIEKAKSGVYKLTAENKKAGRVGQKYGESKKEDVNELHRVSEKNNFKEESSQVRVVSADEKDAHDKKYGMGKYSKESTDKKEEGLKYNVTGLRNGERVVISNKPLSKEDASDLRETANKSGLYQKISLAEHKEELKPEKDYILARNLKEGKEYTWGMGAEYMKCQYIGEGEKPYTYKFKLGNSTHNLSMKDVKDYIKPLSFLND